MKINPFVSVSILCELLVSRQLLTRIRISTWCVFIVRRVDHTQQDISRSKRDHNDNPMEVIVSEEK